jgi:ATP-binding cassette subfamily B protein
VVVEFTTTCGGTRLRITVSDHRQVADQIVVIENGRIIERGSHAQLTQLDGHYARLFSLQAAGYR